MVSIHTIMFTTSSCQPQLMNLRVWVFKKKREGIGFIPSFLPPSLPPFLPPFLPSSLPPFLPSSLPPFLPSSLPPFLPPSLLPSFPPSLPPFLPSFLPSCPFLLSFLVLFFLILVCFFDPYLFFLIPLPCGVVLCCVVK